MPRLCVKKEKNSINFFSLWNEPFHPNKDTLARKICLGRENRRKWLSPRSARVGASPYLDFFAAADLAFSIIVRSTPTPFSLRSRTTRPHTPYRGGVTSGTLMTVPGRRVREDTIGGCAEARPGNTSRWNWAIVCRAGLPPPSSPGNGYCSPTVPFVRQFWSGQIPSPSLLLYHRPKSGQDGNKSNNKVVKGKRRSWDLIDRDLSWRHNKNNK